MALKTTSPRLAALRKEVEKVFGGPLRGAPDYVALQEQLKEYLSDSTIKRIWNSKVSYVTVSDHTLDVLARYAGFNHFEAFVTALDSRENVESELVTGEECVKAENLVPGDKVALAWMPDRECILKYLGDRKFEVIEAKNSKISTGDTFLCSTFTKGRGLYVDSLRHGEEFYDSYHAATEHGLTRAEVL